ncbi:RusA family crossover junction endodeoxyribonuclease [Dyella sp. M7H15-1]|uniref:RusA family crossover junction endodeoxyribonuclease n=1 Tax=Dyella sp. M7H15-1 TaxID=2501295 RepID=UPI0010052258|nr:RusA family crossover junction endodeoxyribonuclease [Dyella sp. M7H15-1]QAU22572.1 RusA family crossover junction endodeoxyribonuclease [Dyella sp. M7H15-1]
MDTAIVIAFTIPGEPVAKGRARSTPLMRNGWPVIGKGGRPVVTQYTPEKTARYENLVRLAAQQAMAGRDPEQGAVELTVRAFLPIPASWSMRKQRAAALGEIKPTKKPDLDNLLKAIKDGANGVTWRDDAQVVDVRSSKRYGTPRVEVEIRSAA